MEDLKLLSTKFDSNNMDVLRSMMDKYGNSDESFTGTNTNDEQIFVSIYYDYICMETWQHNGWIRKTIYHYDGTIEEIYDERWKKD